MGKSKLYFKSIEDNICYNIKDHLNEAKEEGLQEITLIEAIPKKEKGFYWCTLFCNVVEKIECNKAECDKWVQKGKSKLCDHRGGLYRHGNEVKFKV